MRPRSRSSLALAASAAAALLALAAPARADGEGRILAQVVEVRQGGEVLVNVGKDKGVKDRMVFDVYQRGQLVRLPMTNEVAYIKEQVVGRVVVVQTDAQVATGVVVGVDGGTEAAPKVQKGSLLVSNPLAPPINIPPFLRSVKPSTQATEFGRPVTISVDATDEAHDRVYFEWVTNGGLLDRARSSVPRAVWLPPVRKGVYTVRVTAVDTAGNRTVKDVQITSEGFTGVKKNVYTTNRALGRHEALFERLVDVAFDEQNRAHLIPSSGPRLIRMDDIWSKDLETLPPEEKYEIRRAVVHGEHLFAVDMRETRAVRLRIGPKMFQEKPGLVFGQRGVGNGRFNQPRDIAVDAGGRVYVLDGAEEQPSVQVFDQEGRFIASLGSFGKGTGQMADPRGLDLSHDGKLYVVDNGRKMALVFEGLLLKDEFRVGSESDELIDLKVDPFSGRVCVLERRSGQVRSFDPAGKPLGKAFGRVADGFRYMGTWREPQKLRFDLNGSLFLLSAEGAVLSRLDPVEGRETGRWGGFPLREAKRVAAGGDGTVALLVPGEYMVAVLDGQGWIRALIGGEGEAAGRFQRPVDVAFDKDGNICVLDQRKAVQVFNPQGDIVRTIGKVGGGSVDFKEPIRIGTDPDRGILGVLESRDQWNVKVFEAGGSLKACFPGKDEYLEDARSLCITNSGYVFVSVDNKNAVRTFDVTRALKGGTIVDADDQNQFAQRDFGIGGIEWAPRMFVSNVGFLFALKNESHVQVLDLRQSAAPLTQIKRDGKTLDEPVDFAVDDYDRVYILDADRYHVSVFER